MSRFMMDCYFPDVTKRDGLVCEAVPIKATSDQEAIAEAKRVAIWKNPVRFDVRSVNRGGDKTIFAS